MDERDLRNLFQDAPGESPPPGFGAGDVVSASRRATARQRMRIAAGSTAAAVVLAGGVLFAAYGSMTDGSDASTVAGDAKVAGPEEAGEQPSVAAERPPNGGLAQDEATSKQGDEASAQSESEAARTARCEQVDRQLAIALAGELPVDPHSDAVPGALPCADGVRQAALEVQDGDRTGTITVVVSAKDVRDTTGLSQPSASRASARSETDDGATVLLVSDGDRPYESRLQDLADRVAQALS